MVRKTRWHSWIGRLGDDGKVGSYGFIDVDVHGANKPNSIAYGNNKAVVVGAGGVAWHSLDGIDWYGYILKATALHCVFYSEADDAFVISGKRYIGYTRTPEDRSSWTLHYVESLHIASIDYDAVHKKCVVSGQNQDSDVIHFAYSSDLDSWSFSPFGVNASNSMYIADVIADNLGNIYIGSHGDSHQYARVWTNNAVTKANEAIVESLASSLGQR